MDADTATVRRWLLNEARTLQQQQEDVRARLEAVRAIMRLVAAYEAAASAPAEEPTL